MTACPKGFTFLPLADTVISKRPAGALALGCCRTRQMIFQADQRYSSGDTIRTPRCASGEPGIGYSASRNRTGTGTGEELTVVNNHRRPIFLASPSRFTWLLAVQNGWPLTEHVFEDDSVIYASPSQTGPFTQSLTFTGGTGEFAGASGSVSGNGSLGTTDSLLRGAELSTHRLLPSPHRPHSCSAA